MDGEVIGVMALSDRPRPEAQETVAALHRMGVQVRRESRDHLGGHGGVKAAAAVVVGPRPPHQRPIQYESPVMSCAQVWMVTGDNKAASMAVAKEVGIAEDYVEAAVLPGQKLKRIRALQEAGHRVAMVGDGINDSPALAQVRRCGRWSGVSRRRRRGSSSRRRRGSSTGGVGWG